MIGYDSAFRTAMAPRFRRPGGASITIYPASGGAEIVTLTGSWLKSVETNTQIDPLSRSLPTETLTFEAYDIDGTLGATIRTLAGTENAVLRWKIMDAAGEWQSGLRGGIPLGYHLTGTPTTDGWVVKFKAVRALSSLTNRFTGLYTRDDDISISNLNGVMLTHSATKDHGLVTNVEAAGRLISYDDLSAFPVNDANYIGVTELRDALLQVAVASNKVLYTDWSDRIRLTQNTTDHPSVISLSDQLSRPSTDIVPYLQDEVVVGRSVDSTGDAPERVTVGTIEGVYPAKKTVVLVEFSSPIKQGTLRWTLTNCTTQSVSHTSASAWVSFTPTSGSVESKIELTAEPIPVKETRYIHHVHSSGDNEELSCTLVSTKTAPAIAEHRANYIDTMRQTVRIKYRGDPSIEVMDVVRCDIGGEVRPCLVIGAKFSLGTSFSGELTLKPFPAGHTHGFTHNAIAMQAVAGYAVAGVAAKEA